MRQRFLLALMVLLIPASLRADPIPIVDTGPGPLEQHGSFHLAADQWLAVEFAVTSPAVISAVQGWMIVDRSGSLELALYRGGGDIPGTLIFRTTGEIESGAADWRGLSTLAWPVTPGTYWIAFEPPRSGHFMIGSMPNPSERPLRNGAARVDDTGPNYHAAPGVETIGLRVFAESTPAPIPEPASILLLTTGLAGLLARRQWFQ